MVLITPVFLFGSAHTNDEVSNLSETKTVSFSQRALIAFVALLFAFGVIPMRMMTILLGASQKTAGSKGGKVISVAQSRGLIYDRHGERLVGHEKQTVAAVKPTAGALALLKEQLKPDEFQAAAEMLSVGQPLVMTTKRTLLHDDILLLDTVKRTSGDAPACHLIGYTDEAGNGVCGLEKSLNEALNRSRGELRVRFPCDATGKVLAGSEIETIDDNYNNTCGVVLTLDKAFQQAVENAMDVCGLKTGAAVIVDCADGGICTIASRPRFDPTDVATSLKLPSSPLFDRSLAAYPVGSVFKLLIAAAALEQGIDPATQHRCSGSVSVGGASFGCLKPHGAVNLPQALAVSCNCYFIQLMQQLDAGEVLTLARSFGFGQAIELADGLQTAAGSLPDVRELSSPAAKANFSFGQGSLTASPLQIASLYASVFSGGDLHVPYLIKGQINEAGEYTETHRPQPPYKLLKKENALLLSDFLGLAVREGTGKAALVEGADCRGKTATAQSGDYSSGRERLVSWFAGGFTCGEKQYAMAILCDDGVSGSTDCAPVFAAAVRRILANADKSN